MADTGTLAVAANATGIQIATISSGPTIGAGVYWAALQTSYLPAPASLRAVNTNALGGLSQALGYTLTPGATAAAGAATSVSVNQAFGAPPNPLSLPIGYQVNVSSPLVWVTF